MSSKERGITVKVVGKVGIGNMPPGTVTDGSRIISQTGRSADQTNPDACLEYQLRQIETVSIDILNPGQREFFVDSIVQASQLDTDDVTAFILDLPPFEQRQLKLSHQYLGGVDLALYVHLRRMGGKMIHGVVLPLAIEAHWVVSTGKVILPPQR